MLSAIWTCQNLAELYYNFSNTLLFSSAVSSFVNSLLPHFYKSNSPSFTATGAYHFAIPHHWCNGVLTSFLLFFFFPQAQTGENLMV